MVYTHYTKYNWITGTVCDEMSVCVCSGCEPVTKEWCNGASVTEIDVCAVGVSQSHSAQEWCTVTVPRLPHLSVQLLLVRRGCRVRRGNAGRPAVSQVSVADVLGRGAFDLFYK